MIVPLILTLTVLLVPGSIIIFQKKFAEELSVLEKIPLAVAVSLTYWIVGFWWLSIIPVSLTIFIAATLGLTLGASVYLWRGQYPASQRNKHVLLHNAAILLFIGALLTPQLYLMSQQITPGGKDMSMHTYIAALIANTDGFPRTFIPILPVNDFGLYPFGFSTIIAAMTLFNTLPVYTNALILSGVAHFLFDFSLYVILRSRFPFFISAVTSVIVAWTSTNPHLFIAWGANPSVLSLTLLFFAVAIFLHNKGKYPLLIALVVYASLLTNYMFVITAIYLCIPLTLLIFPAGRRIQTLIAPYARSIIIATMTVFPFIIKILGSGWKLPDATRQYIQTLHWEETSAWTGTFSWKGLTEISGIISALTDTQLLLLFTAAGILLFRSHRKLIFFFLYITGIVYFFTINARHWWLPLSSILYPYRTSLILLIPIAWSVALLLYETRKYSRALYLTSIALMLLVFIPRLHVTQFLAEAKNNEGVSITSMKALSWLAAHTNVHDVIWNRYDDAGLWIPAVIFRPITLYHTNPVDMARLRAARHRYPSYAFRNEAPTPGVTIQEDVAVSIPEAISWKFDVVYDDGVSVIYKITR